VRLALPSKGELDQPTRQFLDSAGLAVDRPNDRQYTATIPALEGATVLFQRAADIPAKVEEGSADLGITGYDGVAEHAHDGGDIIVVHPELGYGKCSLVLAVPDSWIDTSSIADLADISVEMREKGRSLRIATKFPRLTRSFLLDKGINHFQLVSSSGAMEAAPTMGYADIIADLTSSGTTLRENRLKQIEGGTVLRSQACLIGNRKALRDPALLDATRAMLELIEARMRASQFCTITANVRGASAEAVARLVSDNPEVAGQQGPTVAHVFDKRGDAVGWFAVTVVVPTARVLAAVAHFRSIGGAGMTVHSPRYVFEARSRYYERLLELLAS
jgi:ATP phosphoribosyltransferase